MNLISVSVLLFLCYLLPETLASTNLLQPKKSQLTPIQKKALEIYKENVKLYVQKNCRSPEDQGNPFPRKFKREASNSPYTEADDDNGMKEEDSSKDSAMMTTLKKLIKRIPQINFYSSIPNAVGVIGQGFSVLDKIGIALGTPLPYYIGSIPVTLFGIALMFIPDLTTLNLPGFYPSGAGEHDPLAAFPPFPDLDGLPDVDLSLSPDNIPPRLIPPEASNGSSNAMDDAEFLSNQLPPMSEQEDEADSPTNPESFQAPRRRLGGGKGKVQGQGHQIIRNYHHQPQQQMPHQMLQYHQQSGHGPRIMSQK